MIAVTGATGHLGRLVIEDLTQRVDPSRVVALARNAARAHHLDVAVREADYDRPDTLDSALAGVGTLLLISSSEVGKRATQHRHVIGAAQRAGVGWIVYTSLLRADSSPLDLAVEHAATEAALRESGVPHTILRNGWYTENYTGSIPGALAAGAFIGSAGSGRVSMAARADYAAAAATVLTSDGHRGRTYELAGDESWTLEGLAAELSRQAGRAIPYRDLPEGEYAAALVTAGLPPELARAIAGWDVAASKGALFDEGRELSRLIGRPTTPLSASVTAALDLIAT